VSITVIATLHPQEGRQEDVVEAVSGLADQIHAEQGCLKYALHRSGRSCVVIVESWQDKESLDAHANGEPLAELHARLEALVSRPTEVNVAHPVPAGHPTQGAL
jgi:quinol monooxygenase YgiN